MEKYDVMEVKGFYRPVPRQETNKSLSERSSLEGRVVIPSLPKDKAEDICRRYNSSC